MDESEKRRIIRDAATIVLLRVHDGKHQVLMGQRGSSAAFMPNKYVFPGGAVDKQDYDIAPATPLSSVDDLKLSHLAPDGIAPALAMAAIRELWEETGLMLAKAGTTDQEVPADWQGFYNKGLVPRADSLRFFFRAITPPGRPRRFDARFFIADCTSLHGPDDDFSEASDELSHLHWIDLKEAKALDLPSITEVVLSEVLAIVQNPDTPRKTPFFHHDGERLHFTLF
ncbi:DNA mismatch repair protein MutT [Rhodobacterales bacterium 52_120_T64]|nr:DNA mismatch repair protein MutT [Rhodobacterales bacterium 52_120_T64]